jgi:hypothetical protein
MNASIPRSISTGIPGPLRPAPDMFPLWRDLDTDFDTAAETIIDAHSRDGVARDLPVMDLRQWGLVTMNDKFALAPLGRHQEPRLLRGNAFSNLMSRVGAPGEFIRDRLPAPLQLATVNWLLAMQEQPLSATLRLRGEQIAALVSDRYAALDQHELLDGVRDALVKNDALAQVRVKSIATGLVDVVRLVFPSEQQAIQVGDVSAVGIDISTSSFGRSALHVRGMVWRLKCKNGLRVAERAGSYSCRHLGDAQRLKDGLSDAIPAALVEARGVMGRWRQAVNVMVDDVQKMIEQMRDLTVGEKKIVVDELKAEAGVPELPEHTSLYSLLNGITAAAHRATPARRLDMESFAGDLLAQHTGRA